MSEEPAPALTGERVDLLRVARLGKLRHYGGGGEQARVVNQVTGLRCTDEVRAMARDGLLRLPPRRPFEFSVSWELTDRGREALAVAGG